MALATVCRFLTALDGKRTLICTAALALTSLACGLITGPKSTPTPTATPEPPAAEGTAAALLLTPEASPTPFMPFFEPTVCAFSVPYSADVDCGFVVVSEDRDGNTADTIRLAVAVYHNPGGRVSDIPIFYLQGGPGSAALTWSAGFYYDFVSPLLAQGDVIFMDHRGTGLSEPSLNCEEIENAYLADLQEDWDQQTRTERYLVAFLGCKSRLILSGVNIKAYTTTDAAADVRDVAAVLGYEQVDLYGISYGTRLAQAVMRDYPELVRTAVLDSVVPLEARMYNDATTRANFALETLFTGCTADPRCAAAHPDLKAHFYELLAQFDKEPVEIEVNNPNGGEPLTVKVGDFSLLNAMMWALHSPSYVSQTPKIIDDIYQGDYEILKLVENLPFASLSDTNIGLRLSIECHEQIFPTTVAELEEDINTYPALVDYGYSYIFGSIDFLYSVCQAWGAAPYEPLDQEPLQSDIPTLILAGQYDPTTPSYYGRQVANHLTNSYFFELPGQGHAPSAGLADNCGLAIALAFLANPEVSPALPCLNDLKAVTFFVPYDEAEGIVMEPFTNDQYHLMGLVPVGWELIGNGGYNRSQFYGDSAQIVFQASQSPAGEWVDFLENYYQNVGLDSTPLGAGTYESNGRIWLLYTADAHGDKVDIVLAEINDGLTWLVMMTSNSAERDALYDALFLPAIVALEPSS